MIKFAYVSQSEELYLKHCHLKIYSLPFKSLIYFPFHPKLTLDEVRISYSFTLAKGFAIYQMWPLNAHKDCTNIAMDGEVNSFTAGLRQVLCTYVVVGCYFYNKSNKDKK